MPRWEPHARERLERAALDLYATQGYENTTVGDIAGHAGVTPRTFFRHFPDKREILFGNAAALEERMTKTLEAAPPHMTPIEATVQAIGACDDLFHLRGHADLARRGSVIGSSAELQERESRKLASFAAVIAEALITRGTDAERARLVADLTVVIFVRASRGWMADPTTLFADHVARATDDARDALST